MKHVAAYLLLVLGGNESPTADDVTSALSSVGVEADADSLNRLIADMEGKDLNEVLESGNEMLAKFGGGGGGGAAAAGGDAAAEEEEEEKVEEEEMDVGGGMDMFGGDDGEGVPIRLVIRLCTDDETVVDFYKSLDCQLELSMKVISDFFEEAQDVYAVNPWANYSLPLQRMRELGFQHRIFDLLDERRLGLSELTEYCIFLFGIGEFDGVPDPAIDFQGFLSAVKRIVKGENYQWHPVKMKLKPLVSLRKLSKLYGSGAKTCNVM